MEEVMGELRKLKAKRVFVQFPEGIRLKVQTIAHQLEESGFVTVLCCEPC
jgi:diphthamide synthase subunit DPH2